MSVLFFDIDNTLLSHRTFTIPESALQGLHLAKEKGHLLFLCSGRSVPGLWEYYDPELFDGMVAGSGSIGILRSKEVFSHPVSKEAVKEIRTLADTYRIGLFLQCADRGLMNQYGLERMKKILGDDLEGMERLGMRLMKENLECPVLKMDIFFNEKTPVKEVLSRVPDGLEVISLLNPGRNDYGSELTLKGITKGSGIIEMMNVLSMDVKDSYGFGDSGNDLPMMRACGTGIAMGNGDPSVKDAADYVTDDIEEDGILNALKHFDLI